MSCSITSTNITDAMIGIIPGAAAVLNPSIVNFGDTTALCKPSTGGVVVSNLSANSSRDTNGILTSTALTTIITNLQLCNDKLPQNTVQNQACIDKDALFTTNVKDEYTYYYALYSFTIKKLMDALTKQQSTAWTGTNGQNNAINSYKAAAIKLNTRVNDITQIVDAVSKQQRTSNITSLTAKLNADDQNLQNQSATLMRQRELLSSDNQNNMVLMKEMEDYSRQKAKYHNNLLMLYSFLNITAIGLLFYVYRSA
jgi:hypothetical protein